VLKSNPNLKGYIKICTLLPGMAFGEEIMMKNTRKYAYTVKVTATNTKILEIKKDEF